MLHTRRCSFNFSRQFPPILFRFKSSAVIIAKPNLATHVSLPLLSRFNIPKVKRTLIHFGEIRKENPDKIGLCIALPRKSPVGTNRTISACTKPCRKSPGPRANESFHHPRMALHIRVHAVGGLSRVQSKRSLFARPIGTFAISLNRIPTGRQKARCTPLGSISPRVAAGKKRPALIALVPDRGHPGSLALFVFFKARVFSFYARLKNALAGCNVHVGAFFCR